VRKGIGVIFLCGVFLVGAVCASFISLQTSVSSKVDGDILKSLIKVVNKGDESAYNVQAEIRVGGKKVLAEKKPELMVDQEYTAMREFKLKVDKPGDYPLVVVMHYTDANQYPFSALNVQTFSYQKAAPPSEVFGSMDSVSFFKEGKLKLTLKNSGDTAQKVMTYLVVPRELSVDKNLVETIIPAKGKKQLVFELENFSALSGSNYQVFAVTEYNDKDGYHQTNIRPGMIKIVETRQILGISYNVVIIILIGLALLFIAAQFIRKK
jgi:hypothetical protein